MFFHEGKENVRVRMDEVVGGKARHIPYSSADFNYGKNTLSPEKWGDLDFGGFRVHYPLNATVYKDEVIVFLGASYFRALGAGARYGLSARGLAVDTVGGNGEEFPHFTEFWLRASRRPTRRSLTIFALLDSPRVDGRVSFDVTPGRRDRGRRARAAIPARDGRDHARHRAASRACSCSARTSRIAPTSGRRSTTPTGSWSRRATASGSGGR